MAAMSKTEGQTEGHRQFGHLPQTSLLCYTGMAPSSRATSLLAEAGPTSTPAPLPPAAAATSEAATAPAGGMSQSGQAQTQVAPGSAELQAANMAGVAFPPATHMQTDSEQLPASSAQAAPSLISAVTQADGANGGATAATAGPTMQSLLEDGHVFMPALPAELQAELASSASSSFSGMATFELMQQQLSSTFDSGSILAGDMAADMLSSPRFAVTDQEMKGGSGEAASAADEAAATSVAAVNAAVTGQMSPGMNTAAFNAAAGMLDLPPLTPPHTHTPTTPPTAPASQCMLQACFKQIVLLLHREAYGAFRIGAQQHDALATAVIM